MLSAIHSTALFLDSLPMGAFVLDKALKVLFWNGLLEDWTGLSRGDVVGKHLAETYPHWGTVRYAGRISPIFDGGPPVVFSPQLHPHLIPSVRPDGQKRIQHTSVTPLVTEGGLVVLVAVQDVTDLVLTAQEARRLHKQALEEIEQRKQIEQALLESSARVNSIVQTATEGILVINHRGIVEEYNPAAERLFSYQACEVIGHNVSMLMPEPFHSQHDHYRERYLRTGQTQIIGIGREVYGKRKDGSTFPMRLAVSEMQIGDKIMFTGMLNDITQQKQLEEQLRSLSMKDGLTGINNRRAFDETLGSEWKRMQRQSAPLSAILMDIDYFKRYNDTYGHQDGDACLKKVAAAIASSLYRPGDFAARYGGEEFVVLLPETDLPEAGQIAERIRKAVEELKLPHSASDVAAYVTVSFGVAKVIPDMSNQSENLVKTADEALYRAKSSGRNRVEMFKD